MKFKNTTANAFMMMVLILSAACRIVPEEDCDYGFKKGTVMYGGAPEVDGCGWTILIDDVTYHPVNLDSAFRIADLQVLVKYVTDPEEFRCGRGGVVYPSVRITEIRMNAPDLGILHEDEWEKYSMDPFKMDSAYLDDDWLMIRVSYSGGCRDHEFKLWRLPPNALDPPPVELALSHEANGDMCEAYITRWLVFSLVPLRERGRHEVKFLLRGEPIMSSYFGEFTYRY